MVAIANILGEIEKLDVIEITSGKESRPVFIDVPIQGLDSSR
jgi:hypothetical protein